MAYGYTFKSAWAFNRGGRNSPLELLNTQEPRIPPSNNAPWINWWLETAQGGQQKYGVCAANIQSSLTNIAKRNRSVVSNIPTSCSQTIICKRNRLFSVNINTSGIASSAARKNRSGILNIESLSVISNNGNRIRSGIFTVQNISDFDLMARRDRSNKLTIDGIQYTTSIGLINKAGYFSIGSLSDITLEASRNRNAVLNIESISSCILYVNIPITCEIGIEILGHLDISASKVSRGSFLIDASSVLSVEASDFIIESLKKNAEISGSGLYAEHWVIKKFVITNNTVGIILSVYETKAQKTAGKSPIGEKTFQIGRPEEFGGSINNFIMTELLNDPFFEGAEINE
jgi:hypothetical protein